MPEPERNGLCQAETSGNTNELPAPFSSSPAARLGEPLAAVATATARTQIAATEKSRRFIGFLFLLSSGRSERRTVPVPHGQATRWEVVTTWCSGSSGANRRVRVAAMTEIPLEPSL